MRVRCAKIQISHKVPKSGGVNLPGQPQTYLLFVFVLGCLMVPRVVFLLRGSDQDKDGVGALV